MTWSGVLMLYLIGVGAAAHVPLVWWGYTRAMGWVLDVARFKA